jgi:hypothetical protein
MFSVRSASENIFHHCRTFLLIDHDSVFQVDSSLDFVPSSFALAEFLSLSTSFATFYLGMYLFVKPATDITTNGEILISLSIVFINIAFFLYAALLLYRSFKEYAIEKLYTTGETDDETRRIQAHLAALTDEQREMIARVDQQRREAAEQQQLEKRRGNAAGGVDPNDGGIEMVNRRRASMAMFGVNVDSVSVESMPSAGGQASRRQSVTDQAAVAVAHRSGHRMSVSGWQSAADITAQMQPSRFAPAALHSRSDSVGIELASITSRQAAPSVVFESVVSVDDDASRVGANGGGAESEAVQRLPAIAIDRDGCISIDVALTHAIPLDLVAFVDRRIVASSGSGAVLQQWTHVGVVVNTELLGIGIANGRTGELYVLEAVRMQTGSAGDGKDEPCNVETGTRTDGVQIRSLREVCSAFRLEHACAIAFVHYLRNGSGIYCIEKTTCSTYLSKISRCCCTSTTNHRRWCD